MTTPATPVRYRRVPGYYNGSTYWVDVVIPGEVPRFIGTVKKTGSGSWNRSPSWRANDKKDETLRGHGTTRAAAVAGLLRKLESREAVR